MKYLIAASLILCAVIVTRKPKEPTDPTGPTGPNGPKVSQDKNAPIVRS